MNAGLYVALIVITPPRGALSKAINQQDIFETDRYGVLLCLKTCVLKFDFSIQVLSKSFYALCCIVQREIVCKRARHFFRVLF